MRNIILIVLTLTSCLTAGMYTEIQAELENVSGNRWMYTYHIANNGLHAGVAEVTFWFDWENYGGLALKTSGGQLQNWDELVWQPDVVIGDNGGYDVLQTSSPIFLAEAVGGFKVSFDWYGDGVPGEQYYEVLDPVSMDVLDSGYTAIPEPTSLVLLSLGGVLLGRKGVCRKS